MRPSKTSLPWLKGLKNLLVHASVARFVKEQAISDELFEQMLAFVT